MRKDGYRSGFTTFRDGETFKKGRPYDPRDRKPRHLLKPEHRATTVELISEILKTATLSRWQHEASCTHMLRRYLIARGFAWPASQAEACSIVSAGFARIGATARPTFEQGQPATEQGGDFCKHCGRELPEHGGRAGPERAGFCDALCMARFHRIKLEREAYRESHLNVIVVSALWRQKIPTQTCPVCGTAFTPWNLHQSHCSPKCASEARRTLEPRECATCGKTFLPDKASSRHCSRECYHASRKTFEERACPVCETRFYPLREDHIWCSNACRAAARRTMNPPRKCEECGQIFNPYVATAKFCSTACSTKASSRRRRERNLLARRKADGG